MSRAMSQQWQGDAPGALPPSRPEARQLWARQLWARQLWARQLWARQLWARQLWVRLLRVRSEAAPSQLPLTHPEAGHSQHFVFSRSKQATTRLP
jgi:hypothetical protein